jgi:Co/Zn/Cd efflux system component
MSNCCEHRPHEAAFTGDSARYRRTLWLITVMNAAMFLIEMVAGATAGSMALKTDALDFAADAVTYGISLWAISQPPLWRARVAYGKGISLLALGSFVLGMTVWRIINQEQPEPLVMGVVGFLALATNVTAALLLRRYQAGDANVRSVWLCSRNDAIGNVAVMIAAALVAWLGSPWPDLAVAGIMGTLFLNSAVKIIRQSRHEISDLRAYPPDDTNNQSPARETPR